MALQTLVAACGATPRPAATATPTEIPLWPQIDAQSYRLHVTGLVATPLSLTCEQLQSLPMTQADRVILCMGEYFHDAAVWSGVALDRVLALAGLQPEATTVRLVAADRYDSQLSLEEAASYVVAQQRAGERLVEKRGFPVRAIGPTDEGWKWVKWLVEIQVS
jgi:DMSO/TMAO reductase YedYZ molybdopterin-dependent catalytic subunit